MTQIRPHHAIGALEVDAVEDALYAFNAEATGHRDGEGLAFVAEADGQRIGTVAGYSWGGICELRQVFVDAAHRGGGLGRRLMEAAIAEARGRRCRYVLLTTYDFQAPGFYRRLGFVEIACVPDKPLGHTEHVMRLTL